MINFLHTAFVNFIHCEWQKLYDPIYIAIIYGLIAGYFIAKTQSLKRQIKSLEECYEMGNQYYRGMIAGLEERLKLEKRLQEEHLKAILAGFKSSATPTDDTSK